jgi:hypothetical protein
MLDAPALRRAGWGHLAVGESPRGSPWNGCQSADSPDGGGRRGFALFCVATDGLTLLLVADPLRPASELDRLDPPQNQFSVP